MKYTCVNIDLLNGGFQIPSRRGRKADIDANLSLMIPPAGKLGNSPVKILQLWNQSRNFANIRACYPMSKIQGVLSHAKLLKHPETIWNILEPISAAASGQTFGPRIQDTESNKYYANVMNCMCTSCDCLHGGNWTLKMMNMQENRSTNHNQHKAASNLQLWGNAAVTKSD